MKAVKCIFSTVFCWCRKREKLKTDDDVELQQVDVESGVPVPTHTNAEEKHPPKWEDDDDDEEWADQSWTQPKEPTPQPPSAPPDTRPDCVEADEQPPNLAMLTPAVVHDKQAKSSMAIHYARRRKPSKKTDAATASEDFDPFQDMNMVPTVKKALVVHAVVGSNNGPSSKRFSAMDDSEAGDAEGAWDNDSLDDFSDDEDNTDKKHRA